MNLLRRLLQSSSNLFNLILFNNSIAQFYQRLFFSTKRNKNDSLVPAVNQYCFLDNTESFLPRDYPMTNGTFFISDTSRTNYQPNNNERVIFDVNSPIKPLHIMMLGLRGFPNVQGGVETHAEHLTPLLKNLDCSVEVLVRSPYQDKNIGNYWKGVKLTSLWAPKSKWLEAIIHTFIGVLYAAVKRPDVLHIHAVGPALLTPLARLLGLKVIVTHHGPDYDRQKWGKVAKCTLRVGEWFGMRFSNGRIVISKVIQDLVSDKHAMTSEIIFNGVVMPNLNAPVSHLDQFGLQKSKYILIVCRLVPEKRHLDLIQAFNQANIEGYKLAIVGSAEHLDDYVIQVSKAASLNKNIVMTGYQTGDVLKSLYEHAALFVLPSSHEGLSISLLEA